ncbi:MAG: hypothetical protein K8I00_01400, partial [Candidatus Omnitrophica bacterium]|nr:hypothetical protein [Candidatus Omnitrophota bacterium]
MLQTIINNRFKKFPSALVQILILSFLASNGIPVSTSWAQTKISEIGLPEYFPVPGTRLTSSASFHPPTLAGLGVDPQNPWQLEFFIDTGDDHESGEQLNQTNQRLINYFLTALTVPDDQLWVNLSP